MATLAALLLMVAWKMSDARHFIHAIQIAPKSDVLVLLTCFSLTVLFDMVIAVSVGVILAALLFMRRMAELTHSRVWKETHELTSVDVPDHVLVYEVAGPLFFGAAEKVFNSMSDVKAFAGKRALVINMRGVPSMDVTGLVAFESMLRNAWKNGMMVVLAGAGEQPQRVMNRAGIKSTPHKLAFTHDLEQAMMLLDLEGR
jgi:SulP family sulfate permease